MTVVELIAGRLQKRRQNNLDVLADAARATAAGKGLDESAVETALVETQQTADDFAGLVEIAKRRRDAALSLEQLPSATTRRDKARAAIETETKRFEEVLRLHREKVAALSADERAAEKLVEQGREARGLLLDVANVFEPLRSELIEAAEREHAADCEVGRINRELREHREAARDAEGWLAQLAAEETETRKPLLGVRPSSRDQGRTERATLSKTRAERRIRESEKELLNAEQAAADARRHLERIKLDVLKS